MVMKDILAAVRSIAPKFTGASEITPLISTPGQGDDLGNQDHRVAAARMAHQRQPGEVHSPAEDRVAAGVERLKMARSRR